MGPFSTVYLESFCFLLLKPNILKYLSSFSDFSVVSHLQAVRYFCDGVQWQHSLRVRFSAICYSWSTGGKLIQLHFKKMFMTSSSTFLLQNVPLHPLPYFQLPACLVFLLDWSTNVRATKCPRLNDPHSVQGLLIPNPFYLLDNITLFSFC